MSTARKPVPNKELQKVTVTEHGGANLSKAFWTYLSEKDTDGL